MSLNIKSFLIGVSKPSELLLRINCRSFCRFARLKPEKPVAPNKAISGKELIGQLDLQASSSVFGKDKAKLSKGLEQKVKQGISAASRGALDTTSEDIAEIITDALDSTKLINMFRGVEKASDMIEIEEVTVNQDYSHVTVWWSSPVVKKFALFVRQKQSLQEAVTLNAKMTANINEKLQKCEGVFRHFVMKNIDYKKVPRIFFRPHAELLQKQKNSFNSDLRQSFLRAEKRKANAASDEEA